MSNTSTKTLTPTRNERPIYADSNGSLTRRLSFQTTTQAVAAKMWVRFVNKKSDNQPCWQDEEEELNKRMNIIGQNGNTGEHYEESH